MKNCSPDTLGLEEVDGVLGLRIQKEWELEQRQCCNCYISTVTLGQKWPVAMSQHIFFNYGVTLKLVHSLKRNSTPRIHTSNISMFASSLHLASRSLVQSIIHHAGSSHMRGSDRICCCVNHSHLISPAGGTSMIVLGLLVLPKRSDHATLQGITALSTTAALQTFWVLERTIAAASTASCNCALIVTFPKVAMKWSILWLKWGER